MGSHTRVPGAASARRAAWAVGAGVVSRRTVARGLAGAAVAALLGCDAIGIGRRDDPVRLGISPGNQTLWRYLLARNGELLRAKGHQVTFNNVETEDSLQAGFEAGRFDAIATLVPALPTLAEKGTPVQFFLPIAWLREGYPLFVPDGSSIQSVADLRGRRVATYPINHPGFIYWRAFMWKHYQLRAEDMATAQTLDTAQALISRQVDAAFIGGALVAQVQATPGFRKVGDLNAEFAWLTGRDRLPVFAGFVARQSWVAQHGRFIADLIGAARQGLELYRRDRNAFLDIVTREESFSSMTRDENAAIATYLGYDAVDPSRVALAPDDVADFEKFFPLMVEAGLKPSIPAASTLFYLPGSG